TEFHLDRIRPDWLPDDVQRFAVVLTAISAGLLVGLADGLVYALVFGLSRGLVNGLAIGMSFALFVGLGRRQSVDGLEWSIRRLGTGLVGGAALGTALWLFSSEVDGQMFGVAFTAVYSLFSGFKRTEPVEQVRWSWRRASIG